MPNNKKVYLEITNRCNLSCAFCPKTSREKRAMSKEEFVYLSKSVSKWANYLYFHLMGEPTSHKLLPEFIEISNSLGLRSVITTNGTLLSERGEEIISAKPYKVNISLHSFEANDGIDFDEYIDSCISFVKKAGQKGILCVLRLWNLDGRASGALNEKNLIIQEKLRFAFPNEWKKERRGERLADRIFLEYAEKFDWPSLSSQVLSESGFCYGLRDQIGVLCDGTVVPCCLDSEGNMALGNLFENELSEILSSKRAKDIYDGFSKHTCTQELCKRCMRASYYRK